MSSGSMGEEEEEEGMRPRVAAMRWQQQQPIAAVLAGVADRLFPRLSSSNSMAIPVQVRVQV